MKRPMPPKDMEVFNSDWSMHNEVPYNFMPDEDLKQWMWDTFIRKEGTLHNPEHEH